MAGAKSKLASPRARKNWGRFVATVLCVAFAAIGAVPLALGFLVRTDLVRGWAARETAALLRDRLGITARYEVRVQAWPLMVGLDDLVVDATDGGAPFLRLERVAIRPRPFSLLAGHLDAGDVEIVGPRIRAVVKDGALQNLALTLPSGGGSSPAPAHAPLNSVAITDARIDLTVDGTRVRAREVDVDLSAEEGDALELALRAGRTSIVRAHPVVGREADEDSVDEDVICRFDTRVRLDPGRVLVRRLTLQGAADFDPDPGTTPSCKLPDDDWRRVEVELGALRVVGGPGGALSAPSKVSGRVRARLPVPLLHRFVDAAPATGAITLDVEADYDPEGSPGGLLQLPRMHGTLKADRPGIDGKLFVTSLDAELTTTPDALRLSDAVVRWADGTLRLSRVELRPFERGMPLQAGPIEVSDVELPGLLRDLGAHPQAHVAWTLHEGRFERFGGTLSPLALEGPLTVQTRGFEIFDRPTKDPARRPIMGVKEGTVHGSFMVRTDAVVLSGFAIDTPRSHLQTTVSLGFHDNLDVVIDPGSRVDLADVSPIGALEMSGTATLRADLHGPFGFPKLKGEIGVERFVFGGFPIGDLEPSPVAFEPLAITLENARVRHGASRIRLPSLRVDFDAVHGAPPDRDEEARRGSAPAVSSGPIAVVDATVDTREAPHLAIKDLLEVLKLDKDPRWTGYAGIASGTARAHYALGGAEDRCGGGYLDVRTAMHLTDVTLLDERYDDGDVEVDFLWDDQLAGADGMRIDVRSAALRKGSGSVLASATVEHGGVLRATAIANGVPLNHVDMLGPAAGLFDGSLSLVANLGGTLSRMSGLADVQISRVRIGPSSLPPSRLNVAIVPNAAPSRVIGRTRCGNPQTPPFDPAEFERDAPDGAFVANGALFGGQIALNDVRISRQQRKTVAGKVRIDALDLGTFANLIPGVAFTAAPPKGTLTASLDVERLPLADPKQATATLAIEAFELEREGQRLRLTRPSGPIRLAANALDVPELRLEGRTASGLSGVFAASGAVKKAFTAPDLDVALRIEPTSLARLSADIPQIRRANGTVRAELQVMGPLSALRYAGAAELKGGELDVEGFPVSLDDIDVAITIGAGEIRLKRASARVGAGTVTATGRMPVRGLELGTAQATIAARGVKLPVADGVNMTADADLEATFRPAVADDDDGARNLPTVRGTIALTSFSYTRPIAMSVDLNQLTGRQRTSVQTYDPDADVVRFDVNVVSPKPLRFSNNLVDMKLEVSPPGVALSGTNQRFGARGSLRILPDSTLTLRTAEFDVREGYVRFEDPFRIAPKVDVHAETEYRRYATQSAASGTNEPPTTADAAAIAGGSTSTSGQWRIKLHAHGDVDNLQLNLSSDPPLGQDDIVLLLTLGMTRAEIERGLVTALGETVGLEALSSLTGADKAVKTIVPIIDELRFGSSYSSRSGLTEPTVTLGKRITDQVRANVTTGLSESREVRSSVEVKLSDRMSLQGSYDNVNDATSSVLGNLGADLRWRLEFE